MLEEIVGEAKVEAFVRGRNFEYVAYLEANIGKQRAGVFDIGRAKIEAEVIKKSGKAIVYEEAIVVGRPASGFEDGKGREAWSVERGAWRIRTGSQSILPNSAKGIE